MIRSYKLFWKNYVQFIGKSSRSEFWYVALINAILGVVYGSMIIGSISGATSGQFNGVTRPGMLGVVIFLALVGVIYSLAIIIPSISLAMRRLQDAGFPWGLWFISFVPYVGSFIIMILCILPTKVQSSQSNGSDTIQ